MKILLLATHLNLGGIGIYTTSLAVQLKALGNEVIIASSGGELAEDIKAVKGITHIDIPGLIQALISDFILLSRILSSCLL